jgi:hypothetical protein
VAFAQSWFYYKFHQNLVAPEGQSPVLETTHLQSYKTRVSKYMQHKSTNCIGSIGIYEQLKCPYPLASGAIATKRNKIQLQVKPSPHA